MYFRFVRDFESLANIRVLDKVILHHGYSTGRRHRNLEEKSGEEDSPKEEQIKKSSKERTKNKPKKK